METGGDDGRVDVRPGTVVTGEATRMQEILPGLLEELRRVWPEAYEGYASAPFGAIPSHAMEDGGDPWWDSLDAGALAVDLISKLNDAAPEGMRFGRRDPGLGPRTDYGWWPTGDPSGAPR